MDVKEFFEGLTEVFSKAIGTSSSADQERDERSVENYVRESGNVHTTPVQPNDYTIGGNNMSDNTTEPDPKGANAIQKDLPGANQPKATDLVDQMVRPVGDVKVSDAPNNDNLAEAVATGGAGVYKGVDGKCETCGQSLNKADDSDDADKVEKAATEDEVTESPADDETVEKAVTETVQKSLGSPIWGGAFAPVK